MSTPGDPTLPSTFKPADYPADQYRLMVESIDDYAIFMLDSKGKVISWNAGAEQLYGYKTKEVTGRHFSFLFLTEDVQTGKPQSVLQRALSQRRYDEEEQRLRKNGAKFWAQVTITALFDPSDSHIGFVEVTRDVTEKRRHVRALLDRAESAFLNSEARYQKLFQYSQEGIVLADEQKRYVDANPSICQMLGYTRDELVGLSPSDIAVQTEVQHTKTAGRKIFRQSGRHREWEFRRKDGSVFPANVLATTMPDGSMLEMIRDVSDRNMVYSEKLFSDTMIDSMPGILYFYDSTGRFLRWNRNFVTVSGYSGKEIARMHPLDFFLDEEKPLMEKRIAEVFAKGESSVEALFLSKNGSRTPYFFTGKRVQFEGEMCLVGVGIDISDRKRAEYQLAESEQKYRELVESANSIILRWNSDGHITFLNQFGQRFFGYSADEIIGRHIIGTIVPTHESSGRDLANLMEIICANPEDFEQNVNENILRNGDRVWISWANRIVRDSRGEVVEFLSIGTDITDRKRIEEERERRHRAEAADHIKSAFLATMSHELRTPLNSIIGFTGIMLKGLAGPLNEEQTKQLGMVRTSARHLLALVNDVLDISKIEAGQFNVAREPFDLRRSITKVVNLIKPQAEQKQLELKVEIAPELGETVGDERRFEQILLNLMSNAVKFTDNGKVSLIARTVADFKLNGDSSGKPVFRMDVSDTGIGIKPEDLQHLFQPFRQVDAGLARNHEGTGLGLAICRRLATLMGGEITAESEWGTGSTFSLILPL